MPHHTLLSPALATVLLSAAVALAQPPAAPAALVVCPGGGNGALADHAGTECGRWLRTPGL